MKQTITRLFAVFGLLGLFATAAAAQDVTEARIIVIDFQRVTTESLVGKDVAMQLESNRVKVESRAGELDQQLASEQDELGRQRNIIAPDAFEERVRSFNQRRQQAQAELQRLNQQHQRAAQQASLEIQRVLRPIVMDLMNEKGATIVLDKDLVYHSVGGLDVTTEVIERLDNTLSSFQVSIPSGSGGGNNSGGNPGGGQ